ncbi:MAG: nucleotidyltransferase domain-containing protein [Anaerolineae bacterium]|nr:nucleotidyltransferase domain-containing protein [Anaerolineae bacterium]
MGIAERWKGFQKLPPDIEEALKRLPLLFEKEGVLLAYLFGSLSRGEEGNDVDLAVLIRNGPAFRLREAIIECLGTERVDLVDLRSASPVLRFEIVRTGRPFYVADEKVQERFELDTLHLYRDTGPLRRQQKDYLKRRIEL